MDFAARSPTRPVGRLAPSPTGRLHLGHARTFLLAWWHARSRGGRVLLRIEDLDRTRVKPGMVEACIEDLQWLGLDWDGPPRLQSEGEEHLREVLRALERRDLAYPCTCTRKEIESAASAPHPGEQAAPYPGTCRGRYASREEAERRSGRPAVLRFRVPPGVVRGTDRIAGPFGSDVAAELGDFPLSSRDGQIAYQLAVVVDDARDGVDEVVRGDDLLESCPRQILLQRALGLPQPDWVHVPLVVDAQGRRLAKRADSLSLAQLRARGVSPESIVAWAARSAGHPGPARMRPADLLPSFSLASLPRSPVPLPTTFSLAPPGAENPPST